MRTKRAFSIIMQMSQILKLHPDDLCPILSMRGVKTSQPPQLQDDERVYLADLYKYDDQGGQMEDYYPMAPCHWPDLVHWKTFLILMTMPEWEKASSSTKQTSEAASNN